MTLEKACDELQAKVNQAIQPSDFAMSKTTKTRKQKGTAKIPRAGSSGMR
jgi:hypothetical protein